MLSVLARQKGLPYPDEQINQAWEILLRNQFHDVIPGSSIQEVYQDTIAEYQVADQLLDQICQDAAKTFIRPEEQAFTLFSSSSFSRRELVSLPVEGKGQFICNGQDLKAQSLESGGYLVLAELSGMKPLTIRFVPGEETVEETPFSCDLSSGSVTTPYYHISWDEQGRLTRVFDREYNREALSGYGNVLELYEDKPLEYENWNIDCFYHQKRELAQLTSPPQLKEMGALRCVLRFSYQYRKSVIEQDMILYADSRRIDFCTQVDWRESQRLLKTAFDLNIRSNRATYDIQYGYMERPTHSNTSWDQAKFEVVGHKWADLSESNYGVSLLNDCKYGYSAKGNTLRLSLLKSGKFPDTQADMGSHQFTYALLPHVGAVADGNTIPEAVLLNQPARVFSGATEEQALFSTNSSALILDACKVAEDGNGTIVRYHECLGGSWQAQLKTSLLPKQIVECNLLEEPVGQQYDPQSWLTQWKPFEIKSFRIVI